MLIKTNALPLNQTITKALSSLMKRLCSDYDMLQHLINCRIIIIIIIIIMFLPSVVWIPRVKNKKLKWYWNDRYGIVGFNVPIDTL